MSIYMPLLKRMLRSVDAVVCTSPNYASTSKVLQNSVFKEKLKVIPAGMIDYRFKDVGRDFERTTLKKFNLEDRPYVLSIGALRYYKGLHTLVEASSAINAPVLIAGCGPEEGALKELAAQSGVTNVIFAGYISDDEKTNRKQQQGCKEASHRTGEINHTHHSIGLLNNKAFIAAGIFTKI